MLASPKTFSSQPYPSPLDRGLIGLWRFDKMTGNLLPDHSGNALHGTVLGPVWIATERGIALDFDRASGHYVDCGDIGQIDGATELTVEAYVSTDDLSSDQVIVTKGDWSGTSPILLMRDEAGYDSGRTDIFKILVSDGVDEAAIEGATNSCSDNDFHYVVATFRALDVLRLYVDGVEDANSPVSTAAISDIDPSSDALWIGKPHTTANKEWDGPIALIGFYKRVFSPSEVRMRNEMLTARRMQAGAPHLWRLLWGPKAAAPPADIVVLRRRRM